MNGRLTTNGMDFGGVQFVPLNGKNGISLGALPRNFNIRMEIRVPRDGHLACAAGPYFRSRAAAPGDGIIGGESSGYWVQLHSSGLVKLKCLNPQEFIAVADVSRNFDPLKEHTLEVSISGESLEAALDGRRLTFTTKRGAVNRVQIPARSGLDQNAAGIAFSSEDNRSKFGGGAVDNLIVFDHQPLDRFPSGEAVTGAGGGPER